MIVAWIKARLREASTYVGAAVSAISVVAPQFAAFDVRFAYAGAAAGFLMMIWKQKGS